MKMADSLRLFALFGRSTPEKWGASEAICIFMKLADSLRLFALFGRSVPENCGTSQAICIFCHPHDEIGCQSQVLSTPFPKIAERLRLSAPPC